jgi:hypothetical protein
MSSEKKDLPKGIVAQDFVRPFKEPSKLHGWFNQYAANCAGVGLFVGDVVMTASGVYNGSHIETVGGGCFVASSIAMAAFGKRDLGFNSSLVLAQAGVTLVSLQDLAHGRPEAWIGFMGYGIVTGLGFATNVLEKKFREHRNQILRNTLGRPREYVALLYCAFNASLFLNAAAIGQKIAYGIYVASDAVLALSKPEQRQIKKSSTPPQP